MFVTDGPFNKMSYSNKQYDELIEKTSSTLVTDLPARWKAFQDAEKILLEDDAAIAPIFQSGLVYLERPTVKGVVVRPFAGIYSYKWYLLRNKKKAILKHIRIAFFIKLQNAYTFRNHSSYILLLVSYLRFHNS